MSTNPDRILLTTQRNFLFSSIQKVGLDTSDFELTESQRLRHANLRHRSTDYYFIISLGLNGSFSIDISPGRELLRETRPAGSWKDVAHYLGTWLASLIRETEVPDLWAAMTGDTQLVRDAAEHTSDNRLFTSAEIGRVQRALTEIKAYLLQSHQLSESQTKLLESRFSYMEESASRLGRKDWLNIVISTLLSIATTLAFNENGIRDLFKFTSQIFRQLLGGMLYITGPH